MMERCKVLLVDDHELVRIGVRTSYADLLGLDIEWLEAGTLAEALSLYGQHGDVDAVLLDLNLADSKGLQGLRTFREAFPEARVGVFSGTQDEFVVRQARMLGAAAYVPKGAMTRDTRQTLMALLSPSRHAQPPAACFPSSGSAAMYERVAELSVRHLEILELVLSGCTNQEISQSTQLSLGTVKNYVSSLLLALDVKSRSHLIALFR